ncbi:MAG: CHAD domain-containing protein [Sporichthyaceae bacterium]
MKTTTPDLEPSHAKQSRKLRAVDVVLAYLGEQRDDIARLETDVRADAPDAVHQMRVATRRARSTLQAFTTVLDRDATRALTDELKWLAGVLGVARDLEVLRAAVSADVAAQPSDMVLGPVNARVAKYFASRQADARRDIAAALDSQRYRDLLAALDVLLSAPPLLKAGSKRAAGAVGDTLAKQRRRVRRHLAAATGERRDVELHEARKAAKRLRYVAEAAEPVLPRASEVVGACKDFQDLLGEHQDAIVAAPYLRDLGRVSHLNGENGFTFGLILGARLAAPVAEPAAVKKSWKTLSRTVDRVV